MPNLNLHHHVWLPHAGAAHTVVTLHGTGGDEHDLTPLAQAIYPGSNILGLRGNVTENGHPRFFQRFQEGMFDEADIQTRVAQLAKFWQAAKQAYKLEEPVTWLGYSNGANTIAALLMLEDVVENAILLRAQAPFKKSPSTSHTKAASVRLLSGEYDPIVPLAESKRLKDELAAQGHQVEQILLPTGHQLSHMDLQALRTT